MYGSRNGNFLESLVLSKPKIPTKNVDKTNKVIM